MGLRRPWWRSRPCVPVRARRPRRRGLAMVETAIVLPLILLLTMGLLEYGWMFLVSGYINNASRQGARVGSTANASGADVVNAVADAMARAGLDDVDYEVSRTWSEVPGVSVGPMLTITVTVQYADVGLGMPLVPTPERLVSTTTMLSESWWE